MGVNLIEADEADDQVAKADAADSDSTTNESTITESRELTEVKSTEVALPTGKTTETLERTDDPVRMYLREMGSVELLSREGEIAIAKRIEAGREAMIAGICESPLTIRAVIEWHDMLMAGNVLTRNHVEFIPVIHRGDEVVLVARSNMLAVSARGEAMQEGGIGERIRVKNSDSGKVVYGQIVDASTIRVGL